MPSGVKGYHEIVSHQGSRMKLDEQIAHFADQYQNLIQNHRTRTVKLPGRKCQPSIIRTFLGYEIQVGRIRMTCPDMITARFMKIFTEIGMKEVQVPYDPTVTHSILPDLERTFAAIKKCFDPDHLPDKKKAAARAAFSRIRTVLLRCSR